MEQFNPAEFTILMVDDTPKNLQVLGSTLKNENYKLEFATSGLRALEWLKKRDFDLVLLDIMMPEMSGFQVCEQIRKDKKYNDLPIIFLTAKTDKESIVKGFETGAQDYVTKPFDTKELLARVKTQLELKYNKEKLKSVNMWLEEEVEKRTLELNQANEKLDNANKELVNLDKTKNEFLRMISHELRTPLNGILGPLHLLKDKVESHELMQIVTLLNQSVDKLEEYSTIALKITELKSLSDIKAQPVNLKELLEFCIIELLNEYKAKNIDLIINHSNNNIQINGIYDYLIDYFKILLHNIPLQLFNIQKTTINYKNENNIVNVLIECTPIDNSMDNILTLFGLTYPEDDAAASLSMDLYLAKLILTAHNGKMEINKSGNIVTMQITFFV